MKIFKNIRKSAKKDDAPEPAIPGEFDLDGIKLEDLSEEEIGSILDDGSGVHTPGDGAKDVPSKDEKLNELSLRVGEMEEKFSRLDASLTNIRSESESTRGVMTRLEGDIKELLSVYEVVSKKFNPFIDMNRKAGKGPTPGMKVQDREGNIYPLSELPINEFEQMSNVDARVLAPEALKAPATMTASPDVPRISSMPGGSQAAVRPEPSRPDWAARPQPSGMGAVREPESPAVDEPSAPRRRRYTIERLDESYLTRTMVMRWIEFLFERLKRNKISPVLEYYQEIGWISDEVKTQIMSYARGEHQDVANYEPEDHLLDSPGGGAMMAKEFKNVEDWRLSAEDHLRSLLFLEMIAGRKVDKDKLNSLEQEISKIKKGLEQYHGV